MFLDLKKKYIHSVNSQGKYVLTRIIYHFLRAVQYQLNTMNTMLSLLFFFFLFNELLISLLTTRVVE